MPIPLTVLPSVLHGPPPRPPQASIPATLAQRQALRRIVEAYVDQAEPVPPLSLEELRRHTERALAPQRVEPRYHDYAAVLLNNHVWREALASVPFERRLLLLPKCLRVEDKCPAPFDELGLLCKQCGLCSIQDLQLEAERLGYAVLVAEGSAVVMALIQTGRIDAIVGVSCLSVLERAFPYMETAAVPGVAIPLLQDDCKDTNVDLEWVWDVLHLTSADRTRRLDLDGLKHEVQSWFEPAALEETLGPATGRTEQLARDWLGRAGKRWRPFLAVCAWKALQADADAALPFDLRRIAAAVECFHKASLIHDDIEDGDALRYGAPTLHAEHGVPVALNVGDLLLGEGYRLLAECDAPAEVRARLLRIAAAGHRTLCLGQGEELAWARRPEPLAPGQVIEIFRQKTAPAFEVALHLGAAHAGAGPEVLDALRRYSAALGVAYQIRDDVADLDASDAPDDLTALRPTLPLALAHERARDGDRELLDTAWRRAAGNGQAAGVRRAIEALGIPARCRGLLEAYKEEAVRALAGLTNASLKGLLRRVIGKIFSVEIQGWCSEFEARNAPGREAGAAPAG
jgi:geranylgeranyl pyrophosphate synthase